MADHLHVPRDSTRNIAKIDNEVLPGTEIMTDVAGAHFVHAHDSTDSAVLVPQPSNDSNDPLVSLLEVSS